MLYIHEAAQFTSSVLSWSEDAGTLFWVGGVVSCVGVMAVSLVADDREALLRQLGHDRLLAHQALFKHRHPNPTPAFHEEIIRIWHANDPHALVMVFREGGKSTIAEEAFVIGAGFQLFHNALIIGSTERRAVERLRAIKHEIEFNEMFQALFGELKDPLGTWNEAEIILTNGVRIIAVGRGQSLRGTKHLHWRPDFCFCDDIEEPEHVSTPEAREETLSWFMSTVLPALDVDARIRINATPLDREALPFRIQHQLKWPTRVYPIEYVDGGGRRRATWPSRYSLDWIDKTKADFEATGRVSEYMREYMCVADDPTKKIFTASMFKREDHVLTWQPVYAFVDPARTAKSTSATTGWAVWSYAANRRLHVWDGGGEFWKPDEIVDAIFRIEDQYRPVAIGVERDGLEEFLLQPLRHEALRRGVVLPVVAMKAPRGKLDFISGLQPHFKAGEVIFCKDLPELRAQFLSYPTGKIDGPNALAYAQLMRPETVYGGDFGFDHVVDRVDYRPREPAWLCLNARPGFVTGVLVQLVKGRLNVIADWVEEGDVHHVAAIIRAASAMAPGQLSLVSPPEHFDSYAGSGLRGAVANYPAELTRGAAVEVGRGEIRALISQRADSMSLVQVGLSARWTVNAFAAGYSYEIGRDGMLSGEPREGLYRTLMEGLESFTGMMRQSSLPQHGPLNYQFTADGRRYISALPGKAPVDAKDEFPRPDVRTPVPHFLRR